MEKLRSRDFLFPGAFVSGTGEHLFPGPFVPGPLCSRELSFPYLREDVIFRPCGRKIAQVANLSVPVDIQKWPV